MQHVAGCRFVALAVTLAAAVGSPLRTGSDGDAASYRHLYQREAASSVAWSPAAVDNLQLLRYRRETQRVLGYDATTGRVFSQRKRQVSDGARGFHNVAVLHAEPGGGVACLTQALTGDNHSSLAWRRCGGAGQPQQLQSWDAVHYRRGHHGRREAVALSSNWRRGHTRCVCQATPQKGLVMQRGSRRLTGCVAAPAPLPDGGGSPLRKTVDPDFDSIYRQHRRQAAPEHALHCVALTAALRLHQRIFIVPMTEMLDLPTRAREESLRHKSIFSDKHRSDSYQHFGRNVKSLPRAQVAAAVKRVVGLVDTVNTAMLRMTQLSAELIVYALARLRDKPRRQAFFAYLHNSSIDVTTMVPGVMDGIASFLRSKEGAHGLCSAGADAELARFLGHPRTLLTPESANMTRIARGCAAYTLGHVECLQAAAQQLKGMLGCLVWGGSGRPQRHIGTDALDSSDVFSSKVLVAAIGGNHLRKSVASGATAVGFAAGGFVRLTDDCLDLRTKLPMTRCGMRRRVQ